jgi:hypothetical protein
MGDGTSVVRNGRELDFNKTVLWQKNERLTRSIPPFNTRIHELLKKISICRGVLFRTVPSIFSSQSGTYGIGKPAVSISPKCV